MCILNPGIFFFLGFYRLAKVHNSIIKEEQTVLRKERKLNIYCITLKIPLLFFLCYVMFKC